MFYIVFYNMDQFRHHKEWEDKCRHNIGWKKSCADCLFDALCLYEKNQEKTLKNTRKLNNDFQKKQI